MRNMQRGRISNLSPRGQQPAVAAAPGGKYRDPSSPPIPGVGNAMVNQSGLRLHCGKIVLFIIVMCLCIPFLWLEWHYSRSRKDFLPRLLLVLSIIHSFFSLVYLLINFIFAVSPPSFELPLKCLYLFELEEENGFAPAAHTWYATFIELVLPAMVIGLIKEKCSRNTP
jgi:hypothetical protein